MTEDEMVRQYHPFNGHEFEQTLADSGGQRSLAFCSPWGIKELGMTEQLNNNSDHILIPTGSAHHKEDPSWGYQPFWCNYLRHGHFSTGALEETPGKREGATRISYIVNAHCFTW